VFDLTALDAQLTGTIFAGKVHFTTLTGSTNHDAVEAARQGAPHGSVFLTEAQSAGRGRGEHGWQSATGEGLYVSVLLRLPIPTQRLHLAPMAAGLATIRAIRSVTGLEADLRWPNDLLIGARKLVGILVESKIDSQSTVYTVTGIGINVHQLSFPSEIASLATSLDLEAGHRVSRQQLLIALLESLHDEMQKLLAPAAELELPRRVERASTWVRGRMVQVHGPQSCTGVTAGLDRQGFLQVQTDTELITVKTGGIREVEIA
jgi:BirA family transcriptional regulator, biotin operon repressor / biotin---[acetyl-CoA-carboxylase] ligase